MKKLAGIMLAACVMLSLSVSALAVTLDETKNSEQVVIGTTVPDTHTITVNADGADVFLGGESGNAFTVTRLSELYLLIRPQENKAVNQVLLNDRDVTDLLSGGYLSLPPVYEELRLTVMTENDIEQETESFMFRGVVYFDGKPLAGATIQFDSSELSYVTDENGEFVFTEAKYGHQTLTAIKNGKVIGYCEFTLNQGDNAVIGNGESDNYILSLPGQAEGFSLALSLTDDGKLQPTGIKGIEQTQGSPQTGDNTNILLWIALISGATITATVILIKRRKTNND